MDPVDSVNEPRNDGTLQLVKGIVHDLRTLSSKEFLAAKLETQQEIANFAKAGIMLAVGVFILAIGVILLTLMVVFLLAQYTALLLWSSLGIVALVYLALGAIVAVLGKKAVARAKALPEGTLRSTKEDIRYIGQKASGH
jgi:VIT1/CCC1 family predicted Fe2+/Mn2+ transporter